MINGNDWCRFANKLVADFSTNVVGVLPTKYSFIKNKKTNLLKQYDN